MSGPTGRTRSGRRAIADRTTDRIQQAIAHFTEATHDDPQFARAFAGLAECHILLSERGDIAAGVGYPKAAGFAATAIRIDPKLSEGHIALAMIRFEYDWAFAAAEAEFRTALDLSPNHPTARQWYAEFLSGVGRHDEALVEIREAESLDPNSPIISTIHGRLLYKARKYPAAVKQFERTLRLRADFRRAHGYLAETLEQQAAETGDRQLYESAIRHWEAVFADRREEVVPLTDALASAGPKGYWAKRVALWDRFGRVHPLSEAFLAGLHARAGNPSAAFAVLEKMFALKDGALAPNLKVNPCFDPLRDDPRFIALLGRMKYPD